MAPKESQESLEGKEESKKLNSEREAVVTEEESERKRLEDATHWL